MQLHRIEPDSTRPGMVHVPGRTFRMGSDRHYPEEAPTHRVSVDGFWLEPHLDISVKLFTMLVYLSGEPELYDAGTDIYDATPEHRLVATAPYEKNKGLIFIPGTNTWHGFTKRPIHGVRKSVIVNWVTPEWRDRWELA